MPPSPHVLSVIMILAMVISGCALSPEAKKARHLERGERYFSQQQYREAIIEYRNALRFDVDNGHAFQQIGLAYYELGELSQAFPFLLRGKELEASNPDVHLKLGAIYLLGRKLEEARQEANVVLAHEPDNLAALFLFAGTARTPEEVAAAIARLERVRGGLADRAKLHLALGTLYLKQGDPARAEQAFQKASEIVNNSPEYTTATLKLAELNLQMGDPRAAIDLIEPLVARESRNAQAHLLLGTAYLTAREAAKAAEVFRRMAALAPEDPHSFYWHGVGLGAQGKIAEARKEFEAALARQPDYFDALALLVQFDVAQHSPQAAAARVKRQLELVPTSGPLHHLLGVTYVMSGEEGKAEQAFLTAIGLKPSLLVSYLALGELYAKTKRYDDALTKLEQAVKINPKNVGAYMLIGVIHERRGAIGQAQAAYEMILEWNPRFGPAANNLAYLYLQHGGDQEKALSLAQQAKEDLPEDPHVSDTLGWILYKMGTYDQAVQLLLESAAKLPGNPEVHYHLGMTHYHLGHREAAKQALAKALEANSRFTGLDEAKRTLAELK